MKQEIQQQMEHSFFSFLARLAQKALMVEAVLSPKPGLVDPISQGAHQDMDIRHFVNSTIAMYPAFYDFVEIGYQHYQDKDLVLAKIKERGIEAEEEMLEATKGVNTHKGIIFSMGYLLSAAGMHKAMGSMETQEILRSVQQLADGIVERELKGLENKSHLSHGEKLYQQYGLPGARGEVESGFINALPAYKYLRSIPEDPGQLELMKALLMIMAQNDDTNVVSRGGIKGLELVKKISNKLLEEAEGHQLIHEMMDFDGICIQRNISPGGSADLLSVVLLLTYIEKTFDQHGCVKQKN